MSFRYVTFRGNMLALNQLSTNVVFFLAKGNCLFCFQWAGRMLVHMKLHPSSFRRNPEMNIARDNYSYEL